MSACLLVVLALLQRFFRPFVVGKPEFSATRGRVVCVPTWILVRTLWALECCRVVSLFFTLLSPAGAAVWLGASGEVGESDGMVAVAMSGVRWRFVVPRIVRKGRGRCLRVASLMRASGQMLWSWGYRVVPGMISRGQWNVGVGASLEGLASSP